MLYATKATIQGKSLQIHTDSKGDTPDVINTIFYWASIVDTKSKAIYIDLAKKS